VLPYLRDERGIRDVIVVRTLHATGAGESVIGEQIADLMEASNPTLGISAKRARYELRLAARATSHAEAEALLDPLAAELQRRLGALLLGSERLEQHIGRLLREHHLTLALYEGHTGAPVYHALMSDDASLAALRGVVIHPLDEATDEAAAASLARSGASYVRQRWHSHLGLGLEDVTTPDPSGATTVCVVLATPDGEQQATYRYDLNQREGWGVIGTLALNMLHDYLLARQP
jgi:nicotinamide mononucleotide (NMN) deamidase PncC